LTIERTPLHHLHVTYHILVSDYKVFVIHILLIEAYHTDVAV